MLIEVTLGKRKYDYQSVRNGILDGAVWTWKADSWTVSATLGRKAWSVLVVCLIGTCNIILSRYWSFSRRRWIILVMTSLKVGVTNETKIIGWVWVRPCSVLRSTYFATCHKGNWVKNESINRKPLAKEEKIAHIWSNLKKFLNILSFVLVQCYFLKKIGGVLTFLPCINSSSTCICLPCLTGHA